MLKLLEKIRTSAKRSNLRKRLQEVEFPSVGSPIVFGTAINYDESALRPFVLSLRRSGYTGRVVFLIKNLSEKTQEFLSANSIEMVELPGGYSSYHIQNARWFHYLDYIQNLIMAGGELPSHLFFTDVRDVFFQGNPLEGDIAYLEFFQENSAPLLGDCRYNSSWIRLCYGGRTLIEMRDSVISCCGTVLGSAKGSVEYLLRIESLLVAMPHRAKKRALDQGPHNYLLHTHQIPDVSVVENGKRVFTIGYTPESEILIGDSHQVLTKWGQKCPIVHQFDRHPKVLAAIEAQLDC